MTICSSFSLVLEKAGLGRVKIGFPYLIWLRYVVQKRKRKKIIIRPWKVSFS